MPTPDQDEADAKTADEAAVSQRPVAAPASTATPGAAMRPDRSDLTPENIGLSAREYEKRKDAAGRVEDVAYTINHALVCSTVDTFGAPISDWTEKRFGRRFSMPGHGGHDHDHGLINWVIGEVLGDYLAVPVTVFAQRHAPGFMNGIRHVMEPALGWLFHFGAHNAARNWAKQHGVDPGSQQCKDREKQIYEHEVRHLPQALMWTVSSSAINIGTQYLLERPGHPHMHGGHMHPPVGFLEWVGGKAVGKLAGASTTAGIVVGMRGLAPHSAEKWDSWTSRNVFLPLTSSVGGLFGVKKEDVERMAAKKEREAREEQGWSERVNDRPPVSDTGRSA